MQTKTKLSDRTVVGVFALSCAMVVAGVLWSVTLQRTVEDTTLLVTGKERITTVSGTDGNTNTKIKNFVYTDDEVYTVADSFWNWHFRAGTIWARIPEGRSTCQVTLSGKRMGFLSVSRNIIAADCVGY
jgi:hypothetical protein